MKKRAFITLTLAVDLDMVAGPWDKPSDWTDHLQRSLQTAAHYKPVVTVHEIIEQRYVYEPGMGYIAPGVQTMIDELLQIKAIMMTVNSNSEPDVMGEALDKIKSVLSFKGAIDA